MSYLISYRSALAHNSHEFMIQAGLIYQTSAGIYTYLPEGLRLLRNLENHCRKTMLPLGCEEIFMPCLLPMSLLAQSDRIKSFGSTVFTLDHNRYYLGPTHEEPVVALFKDIFMRQGQSSHLLPMHLLQFQNKYRNELRPRGGLLRCREFLMQDSYSFHENTDCLDKTFEHVRQVYCDIFTSLDLPYIEAQASSGPMGGKGSIEFHMIHPEGDDVILITEQGQAFNREIAPCYQFKPNTQMSTFISVPLAQEEEEEVCMIEYQGAYLWILQGDSISEEKVGEVQPRYNYVDYTVATLQRFICILGEGNWNAFDHCILRDIRMAKDGDPSLDGTAYSEVKGIEIGHIFKLYDRFSRAISLVDKKGIPIVMGCYGIGISRLLACIVLHHSTLERLRLPECIYQPHVIVLSQVDDSFGARFTAWCQEQNIPSSLRVFNKTNSIRDHYQHAYLTGIRYLVVLRASKANIFTMEDGIEFSIERDIPLLGDKLKILMSLSKVI